MTLDRPSATAVTGAPAEQGSRPGRTWPAMLTLFLLAPAVAELLTGSTPLTRFFSPLLLALNLGLYGSGAVLVREVSRRRGLGWRGLVLLGAAYGVLEEGLVITSWFNPLWSDARPLGAYGRLLDLNLVWAIHLTGFHAIVSTTVPILLTELLFPTLASSRWLRGAGLVGFAVLLTLTSLAGLALFGFLLYRQAGYPHPPPSYAAALAAAGLLVALALRQRAAGARGSSAPPRPWFLRLTGLAATIAVFALGSLSHVLIPIALLAVLGLLGAYAGLWRTVAAWAARPGWGDQHRLALVSGVLAFFIVLDPLREFVARPAGKPATGQTLVAVCALAGLVWLARRTAGHRAA